MVLEVYVHPMIQSGFGGVTRPEDQHGLQAGNIWFQCRVKLEQPTDTLLVVGPVFAVGVDQYHQPVYLGWEFWLYDIDGDMLHSNWDTLRPHQVFRTLDPLPVVELGSDFFYTNDVAEPFSFGAPYAATYWPLGEIGEGFRENLSVLEPLGWFPGTRILAHELGHQLELTDRGNPNERGIYLMYWDALYTGDRLSGAYDPGATPGDTFPEGTECHRAREMCDVKAYCKF
jgi:hypothetical protein